MDRCLLPESELSDFWEVVEKSDTCLRYEIDGENESFIRVSDVNGKYALTAFWNGERLSSSKPILCQDVKHETRKYMDEIESRELNE